MTHTDKWHGFPIYDRPLGMQTDGTDDGRPTVWITDFSVCQPSEHLAGWSLIDYANEAYSGRLLQAPRGAAPSPVTLELHLTGWYAVYVWLMGGDAPVPNNEPDCDSVYPNSDGPALQLSGDARPSTRFRTMAQDQMFWPGLEACFWKYADLTGQSLTIAFQGSTIYLGAIQCIPLAPAEVEAMQQSRANPDHKRMIVKGDAYSVADRALFHEMLRDTDVCAWIAGCEDTENLMTPGGSPGLKAFREDMTDLGIAAYVCERPGAWSAYGEDSPDPRAAAFRAHPEWHCLDRDGTDTHQASYAHPGVIEHMLGRARAVAEIGVDGFGYCFNRDPGLVLFEPVAMQGFQERYGVDPLTLPDRDDRLLDWRAEIITAYLRKLRALIDEVAAEKGFPRIKMVQIVLGDEAANRFYSFDISTWVREGLVDILCPYPWGDYPDRWLAQGYCDVDVAYFTQLVKGTDCKVYPMWLTNVDRYYGWVQWHVRSNEYFTKAMHDYAHGADGISTWDFMGLQLFFPYMADRWLRLGHQEQLADWAAHDAPLPPKLRFTRFDGHTPDRYPAGTGGYSPGINLGWHLYQRRIDSTEYDFALCRRLLNEYLSVRQYFTGDFYPLTPYSLEQSAWIAWQFDRPDLGEGLLQAFRRPTCSEESAIYRLFGLDPAAMYAVTNFDAPDTLCKSGHALMTEGIVVTLTTCPGAAVMVYRQVAP